MSIFPLILFFFSNFQAESIILTKNFFSHFSIKKKFAPLIAWTISSSLIPCNSNMAISFLIFNETGRRCTSFVCPVCFRHVWTVTFLIKKQSVSILNRAHLPQTLVSWNVGSAGFMRFSARFQTNHTARRGFVWLREETRVATGKLYILDFFEAIFDRIAQKMIFFNFLKKFSTEKLYIFDFLEAIFERIAQELYF